MDTTLTASAGASGPALIAGGNKKRGKKRIRIFTPDDRAEHRAIEKQRREALNERFVVSANVISYVVAI
jgi:hypothetical protein